MPLTCALAMTLGLGVALAMPGTTSAKTTSAEWLPFKGSDSNAIGCTWSNGCNGGYHGYAAIDFMVPGGTLVYAAGSGTVSLARRGCPNDGTPCGENNLGNQVRIKHSDGRISVYAHLRGLDSAIVNGLAVNEGRLLGYVGQSGRAYGEHLHYEERTGSGAWGTQVNPGSMKALHGSSLVAYPQVLGYSAWGGAGSVPCGTQPGEPCTSSWAIRNDGFGSGALADGTFVHATDTGRVYRIVGGAPVYVNSWAQIGGVQPTTPLTQAQINALPTYPRNGTFIHGYSTGRVYRVAGGAPIYVNSWEQIGGAQPSIAVTQWAIDNGGGGHLRAYPADGTFIHGYTTGRVYRVAGGAPIYVNSWDQIGGSRPVVSVTQWAIDNGGGGHLRAYPADGTFIHGYTTGRVYRVAGGAPLYVPSWAPFGGSQPSVAVTQWAVSNGGGGHLRTFPADGTALAGLPSGERWVIAGGCRITAQSPPGAVAINDPTIGTLRACEPGAGLETRITGGPAAITTARRARFTFAGGLPTSTFDCRLDSGAWARCASPRVYLRLGKGTHVFRVRTRSAAGDVEATPAVRRWRVT